MSFNIDGFIRSYLDGDRRNHTFASLKDLEELDIFSQITQLDQLDDREHGIESSFVEEMPSRKIIYVRNATALATLDGGAQTDQAKVLQAAKRQIHRVSDCYLMMALAYTAALKKLLKVHNVAFDQAELQDHVNNMIALSQEKRGDRFDVALNVGTKDYFALLLNHVIVPTMLTSGLAHTPEEALSVLDKAKDWVGLEHDPIAMITLNKRYSRFHDALEWIVRLEEPVTTLTPSQRQQLDNYQHQYWYQCLSSHEQMLFKNHYKELLESESGRVIPSQLRSKIPFLKNAYRHKTYLIKKNEDRYSSELLLDVGHCGGLPYFDKRAHPNENEVLLAAKHAISQLANYAKDNTERDRSWQHHSLTLNSLTVDSVRGFIEPIQALFKVSKKKVWPFLLLLPYVVMTLIVATIKLSALVVSMLLPFGASLKRLLAWTGSNIAKATPDKLKKAMVFLYDKIWSLNGLIRPYIGFDYHIVQKTKEASRIVDRCYSSNICLNGYSAIESHDYDGIYEIIQQAERAIGLLHETQNTDLAASFQKDLDALTREMGLFSLLAVKIKLMSWSLSPVVLAAKSLGYFMRVASLVSTVIGVVARAVLALVRRCLPSKIGDYFRLDKKVSAMQVMGKLGMLVSNFDRAYKALPEGVDVPKIHLWFGCASGDNRTGLAAFKMQEEVVTNRCSGNASVLAERLAMDRHTQCIGSLQSSIGRFGHRKKSSYSFRSYPASMQSYFFTPYSDVKSAKGLVKEYEESRESLDERQRVEHDKLVDTMSSSPLIDSPRPPSPEAREGGMHEPLLPAEMRSLAAHARQRNLFFRAAQAEGALPPKMAAQIGVFNQ